MTIIFLKSCAGKGVAYKKGSTHTLSDELAKGFIKGGLAKAEKPEPKVKPAVKAETTTATKPEPVKRRRRSTKKA